MGVSIDDQILRTTKEIVVKFIEVGRVSPTNFHDIFKKIYSAVKMSVTGFEPNNDPVEKPEP